jgi:molecular chaperone GrpE
MSVNKDETTEAEQEQVDAPAGSDGEAGGDGPSAEASATTSADSDAAEPSAASSDAAEPSAASSDAAKAPPVIDLRDARIADLEKQLAETVARLRAVSKGFADQQDEMAAFRERLDAQAKAARARREAEVVRAFFEPVQNLKRSIDAGFSDAESFLTGIKMVHQQFTDELAKLGLRAIPGVGADFDPKLHEAIAVMPVADATQDGKILFVHLDGYMVDGKPVQVGQVVIGKYAPAESAES